MTTIAYLRVSTDQQADSGAGLDAQHDACAKSAGVLAGVYRDEGVSGSTGLEKRPALLEAIGALKKGDVLIVAKRDRLGRDPLVVAMIESAVQRKGARIVSAAGEGTGSDSPADVLMRRMVDAFAEYERLIIGARTKAALQAKKARGERTGSVPYGYRLAEDGVHLDEDPTEQEVLRLVRLLRDGGATYRTIAQELASRGYSSRTGSNWHPQTIKNIAEATNGQAA
jgi:DNA invertase Pin-like site-specific DNA recombinase